MQDIQEEDNQTTRLCRRYIRTVCETSRQDGPKSQPLNILIVGKQGCGKSSFIDSIAAALSEDRWVEYASVGSRDNARQVTNFIFQYNKCCNSFRPQYNDIQLPTLIDVPGLLDTEPAEQVEKFLRLLMYGHIPNQESALQVYENCNRDWDDLVATYSKAYDDMKVDRVVFVASAVDDLPARLMDCVMNVARPPSGALGFRRQIPVFGVITKMDKVKDDARKQFEEKKEELKKGLGLNEARLLCCSNYCDDTDPDNERLKHLIPDLDLPVLKFLREVCDRSLLTVNPDDVIRLTFKLQVQAFWRRHKLECLAVPVAIAGALQIFLVAFLLHSLLITSEPLEKLKQMGPVCYYDMCAASGSAIFRTSAIVGILTFFTIFACLVLFAPPRLVQWLHREDKQRNRLHL